MESTGLAGRWLEGQESRAAPCLSRTLYTQTARPTPTPTEHAAHLTKVPISAVPVPPASHTSAFWLFAQILLAVN